jgi:hypothetical protein
MVKESFFLSVVAVQSHDPGINDEHNESWAIPVIARKSGVK